MSPIAGSKCAHLENVALDIILGGTAWTASSTVYIALSVSAFVKTSTGSSLNEVSTSGTGYSRIAVTNNATNWPNAVSSIKSNGAVFTFATATAPWGLVQSFYIIDSAGTGNALYGADLAVARSVNTGDTAAFANSAIVLTEA